MRLTDLCLLFFCSIFFINVYASHLYVTGQGGVGGMLTSNYPGTSATDQYQKISKRNGLAWRVAAGFLRDYDRNKSIGVEMGYESYPKNIYTRTVFPAIVDTYRGSHIDLLGVGAYQLKHGFSLLGKLGVAYVRQKFNGDIDVFGVFEQRTLKEFHPKAAIGVIYNASQIMAITMVVDYVFAGRAKPDDRDYDDVTEVSSTSTVMLGVNLNYPV